MALVAGSVTVSAVDTWSGTGLALALFEGRQEEYDAITAEVDVELPDAEKLLKMRVNARLATKDAEILIGYLIDNAVVTVGAETGSLG